MPFFSLWLVDDYVRFIRATILNVRFVSFSKKKTALFKLLGSLLYGSDVLFFFKKKKSLDSIAPHC